MQPVFIIAEAGVNHNGDRDIAFQLIDVAVKAGADAIKFQTFKTENLVTESAEKAIYQKQTTDTEESQFAMLKRLEIAFETHHELMRYSEEKGIEFMSTAFDLESLDFLVHDLRLKTLKIPSGEITNGPLLLKHALSGCDLILSTGMSTLSEIREALSVLAFGFLTQDEKPSTQAFALAFDSPEGEQVLREKVILLHCTTNYPAPYEDINLRVIQTLRETFGLNVGLSDHSQGTIVPLVAIGLGACVIEKHFTLDKKMSGPDHTASLDPDELGRMIREIRLAEKILGIGRKEPQPSELSNIAIVRKSLVASKEIKRNEFFNEKNIISKRPGNGISPMNYWNVLNTRSKFDFKTDDLIQIP